MLGDSSAAFPVMSISTQEQHACHTPHFLLHIDASRGRCMRRCCAGSLTLCGSSQSCSDASRPSCLLEFRLTSCAAIRCRVRRACAYSAHHRREEPCMIFKTGAFALLLLSALP